MPFNHCFVEVLTGHGGGSMPRGPNGDRRSALGLLLFLTLVGCDAVARPEIVVPEHRAIVMPPPPGAWDGLLDPVAITSDEDGRIYVGDRADRTIKMFDERGIPDGRLGGFGSGPGELSNIEGLIALRDEVVASDPQSLRFVRFDQDGTFLGHLPNRANSSAVGTLGPGRIILSGSPLWAMEAEADGGGILFEVVDRDGEVVFSGGERRSADNPFVGHIRNFALPAGSRDGAFVWLAYLNHPSVARQPIDGGAPVIIERTLPFDWQELPDDFEPSSELMAQGGNAAPPFDVISLSIATDAGDRAFVLTALESVAPSEAPSSAVSVDVLHPEEGWTHRIRLPYTGTALTVSPDGSLLYVLDDRTAQIRVYEWPDNE